MDADQTFIRRAIRLAMNGRGTVEPNPMVGCVIVKDNRIIGEGYHAKFGGPHAEPAALDACTESPAGATAYVTLEPCCHTGKKTPPCAPRLIHEKISRVVVGCLDPNPQVNGNGVRMLREAGITVDGPVLDAECRQLIAPFLASLNFGLYTTLKWAESADGRVAGGGGRRRQISNPAASAVVQQLRSRSNGILIGINTALNDDPTLLPRGRPTPPEYRRIVLDSHLRLPPESNLVRTVDQSEVMVIGTWRAGLDHPDRARALSDRGVVVDSVDPDESGRLSVSEWYYLRLCSRIGTHLLVEPGPTLAATMLSHAARLWVIRSPTRVDDSTAPSAAAVPPEYVPTARLELDGDVLTEYLNTRSPAYFAAVPSADLVLAGPSSAQEPHLAPGDHARG